MVEGKLHCRADPAFRPGATSRKHVKSSGGSQLSTFDPKLHNELFLSNSNRGSGDGLGKVHAQTGNLTEEGKDGFDKRKDFAAKSQSLMTDDEIARLEK